MNPVTSIDPRDERWLEHVVRRSEAAVAGGAIPFAGLVVVDGQPVAEGINQVAALHDPTAHAEVQALRAACRHLQQSRLSGAVLYASGEPCAMCMVSAVLGGVSRVVYAADAELAARHGFHYGKSRSLLSPYSDWPIPIVHAPIALGEAPFEAWRKRHDPHR